LAPQDGFILDSLGWVHFRLGNTELALKNLLEAFAMKPEADIAAHLGEVFWTLNRTQEAEKYWRMGEKLDANNATLKETIKRFKPEWIISNPKNQKQWDGRFAVKFKDGILSLNRGAKEICETSNEVYLRLKDYLGPDVIQDQFDTCDNKVMDFTIDLMISRCKII
jgi:tetratricopeptide (TPR) repeat protein